MRITQLRVNGVPIIDARDLTDARRLAIEGLIWLIKATAIATSIAVLLAAIGWGLGLVVLMFRVANGWA